LGMLPIALFGTAAQQEQYVRPMERGEKVAAFAVSELGAGTELSAITTTAIPTGDGYRIDGAKAWISHATIADFFVVLARSSEAEGALGLSLFAVDRQSSGVEVKETPLLSPRPFGQVEFRACHVPAQNLIGVGGRGLYAAMSCLELARPTVGAAALGFAKRALEEAVRYCTKRKVSGKRLSDYQMTKQKLAEMSTAWHASRLLVYQAAWSADTGRAQPFKVGAMAKWFATEHAQSICDDALQLCGASGLVANSTLESLYRSVRSLRIYEGTTEILKLAVADDLLRRRPEARDHA
jgi:acyl-CoA dehydrogenase